MVSADVEGACDGLRHEDVSQALLQKVYILEQSVHCCGSLSILKARSRSLEPPSRRPFRMPVGLAWRAWKGQTYGTRCLTMLFVDQRLNERLNELAFDSGMKIAELPRDEGKILIRPPI